MGFYAKFVSKKAEKKQVQKQRGEQEITEEMMNAVRAKLFGTKKSGFGISLKRENDEKN